MLKLNFLTFGNINKKILADINIDDFEFILAKTSKQKKIINNIKEGIIDLIITDDVYIQKLNSKYRFLDKPTDVLSFSDLEMEEFPNFSDNERVLGEIFISIDTAQRQSLDHGNVLQEELNKLFVHGILHIFGFCHNTNKDFFVMNFWEQKLLKRS